MTLYQLRTSVARAEVTSSLGTLRFATLTQGRCYAEGLANGGHESAVRDRWRSSLARRAAATLRLSDVHPWRWRTGIGYYPAGAFLPLDD